jgi:hypothetical protein
MPNQIQPLQPSNTNISNMQNSLFVTTMNIFNSLSFYSPLIICVSVIVFSMFTVTIEKALFFFMWIFSITFLRIIMFQAFNSNSTQSTPNIPDICTTGLTQLFIKKDVTYSTYILSFTMMYFLMPMIMVSKQHNINDINYGVMAFFIVYICLDIFIKKSLLCIPSYISTSILTNVVSGIFLGGLISGVIMYGTTLKPYLYINELNTNKEVCSMPSKQQFRCSVYKNGTLVGNM